ncbi:nucleotide-binding oligomerization domain-containing protein 1-like [Dysidea avara]|uniref:nucleotide-binding oligomerization domain-containing protein 1-like n=1 Tax=Dysidea avara TaxID=196820 RepID=UPI00332B5ACD
MDDKLIELQLFSTTKGASRPTLQELYEKVLLHFAKEWKRIGVFLGMHHEELDIIEKDNQGGCRKYCEVMLKEWLNVDEEASWPKIFTAVNSTLQSECVEIQKTTNYLKELYKDTQFTGGEEKWLLWPDKPKFFNSIALVHHKNTPKGKSKQEINVMAALKCKGNINTIPKLPDSLRPVSLRQLSINSIEIAAYLSQNNVTKAIADIFHDNEGMSSPQVILIDGPPGIGKTYLCKEIAYQWSQDQILSTKKFLFLLRAHEQRIQVLKEVKDLIKYCCHLECEETIDEIYQYIKEREGATLVILIDGYNELSVELPGDCLISQLISRQRLRKCDIVITSRSFTYGSVCQFADCRKEIIGFTNNDRQEYIQQALANKPDDTTNLKQYFDSHPTVSSMCYIPLYMTILLFLFTKNNLPRSRTEFYEKFVDLTIKLHIEKDVKTHKEVQKKDSSIDSIKQKLGQFSYDTLKKDHMVFGLEEVQRVYPEITENCATVHGFGLLQATQHFTTNGKTLSFNFIHSSVQEYLAAYYIQSLPDDKQLNLLRDTFWNERYLNTWIIYVGITKGKVFAFKHFLSGNQFSLTSKLFKIKEFYISPKILQDKIKCLYLFQCFKEAQDETMCKAVSESVQKKQIDLSKRTLSPNNVITLGFFLTYSYMEKWEKLDISSCHINDHGLRDLWRALFSNRQSKVCIKIMNLSGNQLSEICAGAVADLVKSCKTEELYISNNELGDAGAKSLISYLPDDTCLKLLLMDGNKISADAADYIEQSISSFPSLKIVGTCHLYVNSVLGDHITTVIGLYSTKCELTKFSMYNCPVNVKHLEDILNLLVKNTNLVTLQFSQIGVQKPMVNFFTTALSSLKCLSNFSLIEPSLCETAVDNLVNSLSASSTTKMIIMSDIKIHARQSTYLEIVKYLKLNATVMKIPNCSLKDE